VAKLDDDKRARFILYSNRKYSGLLTGWLSEIEPVVMHCESCGHCWYKDQPSDHQLSLMYAAGNRLHPDIQMTREPSHKLLEEMKRLRALVNQATPSYLDYGSGFGRWARAASQVGFDVCAFEPSQSRGAEENAPFTLVHNINELNGKTFDVINLEQVLEHISDPLEVLIGIRAFCSKKSIVRVTVPNILRCDEGRNIWKEWPYDGKRPHVMAPFEHLHGFTPLSLNKLMRRAGYKTLPIWQLYRHYPMLLIRNAISPIYPAAGQTMLLMQLSHS
jgi:SAM-dependent methyltransferase